MSNELPIQKTNSLGYGNSGVGKTTLGATLARFVHDKYGLKTRVAFSDTSVTAFDLMVEQGFVELMQIDQWSNPFLTMDQVTRGFWPRDPRVPNSQLLPGLRIYRACPLCGKDSGARDYSLTAKCASCGKPLGGAQAIANAPVIVERLNGLENVGAYVFEGLWSWGKLLQQSQATRMAKGEEIGVIEKAKDGGAATTRFQDGVDEYGQPFMIGGNTWSHYNVTQDYLHRFHANSKRLPVHHVYWTSLESLATDTGKKGGRPIYAPDIPGTAASARSVSWFYEVFHLDLIEEPPKPGTSGVIKASRRMYLAPHSVGSEGGFPYLAKVSLPAGVTMPESMGLSFPEFFEKLEAAKAGARGGGNSAPIPTTPITPTQGGK